MFAQTQTVEIVYVTCADCGVPFSLPKHLNGMFRENKKTFFCPNGHRNIYRKSDADEAREEAARLRSMLENSNRKNTVLASKIGHLERSKAAIKGQLTKTKKRVSKGVCPCCNRTFENLARHMAGQHPEYKA